MFGGYANIPWTSTDSNPSGPDAFLFRLKKANAADYMKFAALNTSTSVCSHTNNGPCFGNTTGKVALVLFSGTIVKQAGQNFFPCSNMQVNFANGFQQNGQDNNALHGANHQLINIEVYSVEGE